MTKGVVMADLEDEYLSQILDPVSPFEINCAVFPDAEDPSIFWFQHPQYPDVLAKFGPDQKGRLLRIWIRKKEGDEKVVLLSANFATEDDFVRLQELV